MSKTTEKGCLPGTMSMEARRQFDLAYRDWEKRRYGRRVERDLRASTTLDIRLHNAKKEAAR